MTTRLEERFDGNELGIILLIEILLLGDCVSSTSPTHLEQVAAVYDLDQEDLRVGLKIFPNLIREKESSQGNQLQILRKGEVRQARNQKYGHGGSPGGHKIIFRTNVN